MSCYHKGVNKVVPSGSASSTEGWPLARCSVHNHETQNCSSGMRNQRKLTNDMSCYRRGVNEGDSGAIWEYLTQLKVGHLRDVVCII